jgi:ribosomal protein L16/L10AE
LRLPDGDRGIVDVRKLEDYCLSPEHPRGRHKARVFLEALGLTRNDANWLRSMLLEAARRDAARQLETDASFRHLLVL